MDGLGGLPFPTVDSFITDYLASILTLRQALTFLSSPTFDRDCLLKPPIARICGYHPMNRVTWVPPSGSKASPPRRWVRLDVLLCLHCASTVESTDTRVTGCEVS